MLAHLKSFAMLWHLRHWLQYRQLRTWIHDILCYQTIKLWHWTAFAILAMFIAVKWRCLEIICEMNQKEQNRRSQLVSIRPLSISNKIFCTNFLCREWLLELWILEQKNLWVLKVAWKGSVSLPACYFTHNIFQFYWKSFFFKACWSDGNENDF